MKFRAHHNVDLTDLTAGERVRVVTGFFLARNRMWLVVASLILAWLGLSWLVMVLERGAPNAQITSIDRALWWGIVTMMTIGYGDLVPVTGAGRIAAAFLMMAGVTAIGIISARISAHFLKQVLFEGRGSVDRSKIKDHVIVCGWKDDMQDLLRHILQLNPALRAQDIVVVANRTQEDISSLKSDPRLSNVTVILGDYFQQSTLLRAAPDSARKVLILADNSPGQDGRKASATEADARTIMTAIALSNIAKGTVVAAEIIDPTLDQYLKIAGVAEIIYTREFSRLLLGSASGGLGLINVFHDLVDPRGGSAITTRLIPEQFIEGSYGAFRAEFEKEHQDMLVIGILENSGNPHSMKAMAFKEAQKTPSVNRLIENLQNAKSLRCNNPVLHPRPDYRLPRGASAIVLVNEHGASQGLHHEDGSSRDNVAA